MHAHGPQIARNEHPIVLSRDVQDFRVESAVRDDPVGGAKID
jgi:hypothetical protein